jgi:hypothetical protein
MNTSDFVFLGTGFFVLIVTLIATAFPQLGNQSDFVKRTNEKIKKPTDVLKYYGYQIAIPVIFTIPLLFIYKDPIKLAGIGMAVVSFLFFFAVLFRDYFNAIEKKKVQKDKG